MLQDAQRLLAGEAIERVDVVRRREQDLDELRRERLGQRRRHGPIDDDDTSVGRHRIRGESLRVRLLDRVGDGDTARVRVLHDDARRAVELSGEQPRRGEVAEVVERQLLPLMLHDEAEEMRARATLGVVGRALMRVLSVRQLAHAVERRHERLREAGVALEPARDRRLVRGRSRERDRREPSPKLGRRRAAPRPQLAEHLAVVARTRDDGDGREVLGGSAQQRRPADVDHLDEVGLGELGAVDGELERVEVHAHEVERLDSVLRECDEVLLATPPGEDPRMDARMQRLHATVEELREPGHVLDLRDRETRLRQRHRGAAARHELESELREPPRELGDTGLVVDGDQRAHSSRTTFGSSRCSASCTRSRSVSTVSPGSTGTGSLAITSPVSTPSSTKWTVAAAAVAPAAKHVVERMRAGKLGKRRRVHVDDATRETSEERRPEQVHVAGADDELDALFLEPVRHRRVSRVSIGEPLERKRRRRDAHGLGTLERSCPRDVRRDRDDRQPRIEKRLQIRPLP